MVDPDAPDVTILIPAKNEEDTIREVLERVLSVPLDKQVIVIEDGSSDRTASIVAAFGDEVTLIRNEVSRGKGAAIRRGLSYATGTVVVIQDADLEYFPEELPLLVEPILAGQHGVVYGTRFSQGFPKSMAWPNRLVNRLLVWAVRLLFGMGITDEATCYKALRRDLLDQMDLQCERFEFCPEVTAKAIRLGESIHEVPVRYEARTKAAGKKIRWTDAPEAFWTLLRYRSWRP